MRHARIIVTRCGGPDALAVVEEDRPAPKRGEVRVPAAGVSLPDLMMREGVHPESTFMRHVDGKCRASSVDSERKGYVSSADGQRSHRGR